MGEHWLRRPDGRVDLKWLAIGEAEEQKLTHRMCCICFEYIPVDELYVDDDGQKWDVCQKCELHEQLRAKEQEHERRDPRGNLRD